MEWGPSTQEVYQGNSKGERKNILPRYKLPQKAKRSLSKSEESELACSHKLLIKLNYRLFFAFEVTHIPFFQIVHIKQEGITPDFLLCLFTT